MLYKQHHNQHQVPHKFQFGDKYWLPLYKEHLIGAHRKLRMLQYEPYNITKVVVDFMNLVAFKHRYKPPYHL